MSAFQLFGGETAEGDRFRMKTVSQSSVIEIWARRIDIFERTAGGEYFELRIRRGDSTSDRFLLVAASKHDAGYQVDQILQSTFDWFNHGEGGAKLVGLNSRHFAYWLKTGNTDLTGKVGRFEAGPAIKEFRQAIAAVLNRHFGG